MRSNRRSLAALSGCLARRDTHAAPTESKELRPRPSRIPTGHAGLCRRVRIALGPFYWLRQAVATPSGDEHTSFRRLGLKIETAAVRQELETCGAKETCQVLR